MKPKTISYSESKESIDSIGLKSWRKAGVEIEIEDGDSPEGGFDKAKMIVYEALVGYPTFTPIVGTSMSNGYSHPPVIDKQKEKTEIAIDNASTKEELLTLQNDAWKYKLEGEYLKKLKTF